MKNIDLEKLGYSIQKFSEYFTDILDVIWNSERTSAQPDRFYYSIYIKMLFILDATSHQVINLKNKPQFAISLCLQLRTCMLDVLNVYYVMDKTTDSILQQERINNIMIDQAKYVYPVLSNEDQIKFQRDWPELMDSDLNLSKPKERITSGNLASAVSEEFLKPKVVEAKHIYDLFSKFEHNGAFTFDMVHRPFFRNDHLTFLIQESIIHTVLALRMLSINWLQGEEARDTNLKEKFEDLSKELPKL